MSRNAEFAEFIASSLEHHGSNEEFDRYQRTLKYEDLLLFSRILLEVTSARARAAISKRIG